jgi:hypothetical protein
MNDSIEEKLNELVELCWQGGDSVFTRNKELTDWEVGEKFVALSKEVASHYRPLVEKLVEARIPTVNIIPQCAVYEVDVVLPEQNLSSTRARFCFLSARSKSMDEMANSSLRFKIDSVSLCK